MSVVIVLCVLATGLIGIVEGPSVQLIGNVALGLLGGTAAAILVPRMGIRFEGHTTQLWIDVLSGAALSFAAVKLLGPMYRIGLDACRGVVGGIWGLAGTSRGAGGLLRPAAAAPQRHADAEAPPRSSRAPRKSSRA